MANHTNENDDDSIESNEESSSIVTGESGSKVAESDSSNDKTEAIKQHLAQRESKQVFQLRLLVFLVLLLASVAVSVVVYLITTKSETDDFEAQFKGAAKQIQEAFVSILTEKLGAISALGVAAIAHGVDHNEGWPFVTLSAFQQRASTAQSLSNALFLAICPQVNGTHKETWESFIMGPESEWASDGFNYQKQIGVDQYLEPSFDGDDEQIFVNKTMSSYPIFYVDENGMEQYDVGPGPYLPVWETSPVLRRNVINQDLYQNPWFTRARVALDRGAVVIGRLRNATPGYSSDPDRITSFYATILSISKKRNMKYEGDMMTNIYLPLFNSFGSDRQGVGVLVAIMRWASYFENVLPPSINGLIVVLQSSCGSQYTYEVNGADVVPLGYGDLHDHGFESLVQTADFEEVHSIADGTEAGLIFNQENQCDHSIRVYPSRKFSDQYHTSTPAVVTSAVVVIFVFTACMFLFYDRLVDRRQKLIMRKAIQSTAIVQSLFPKNVRDRLLEDNDMGKGSMVAPNHRLKSYLKGDGQETDLGLAPIADLFPHATVLFADIAGFTAWSSTRDPAQVFILLQTVYQAFDSIAKRRNVFKVETIGDSYVAVTGLPEPQEKHALIMARFASDCMIKMNEITKDLEVSLGPDTGELSMRMGLHSGPVTAGVLRGERSRFQLFGDTVNTAARMESTGIATRIQISQNTADLLIELGKEHWVTPRKDVVEAKGKGIMKTFWLVPTNKKAASTSSGGTDKAETATAVVQPASDANVKQGRLVNWIVELLADHIKQIQMKREVLGTRPNHSSKFVYKPQQGMISLDEVAECITLPKFNAKAANAVGDHNNSSIKVDPEVHEQLVGFVSTIAGAYRDNPFHNFEHACHVTMSVNKFLKRIVSPDLNVKVGNDALASQMYDYTHGINSDPLTHFAIVLSALIHDVDHRGVSNVQLIKEDEKMAALYRGKSVAEQNSLDLSWDLLMTDQYERLRRCLFADDADLRRFRQVMVNMVLATDIFDKELNDQRRARWNKAFGNKDDVADVNDLKATIVIEHIIQASDVSHTMQHWHIYRKWNQRLFTEMYYAFRAGRMGLNPATFWYKGELGFFDNYIVPLAKKLKDCNVFGVSSDECLNYALKNRVEWEERGQEIVASMVADLAKEEEKST